MSSFKHPMKPCPFCGAVSNSGNQAPFNIVEVGEHQFTVTCSCGARGPIKSGQKESKDAWNDRHSSRDFLFWNPFRITKRDTPAEFKGRLESVNLASILQFFSSEKKTGILQLARGQKKCAICLKSGNIIAASCNWGYQLGHILHEKGLLSKKSLEKSLQKAAKSGKSVGEILLSSENISLDALLKAVRHQIREVVMEVLFWADGNFQYCDHTVDFGRHGVEEISTIAIILEATVRNDELDAA
jgi:hypothetical protein